MTTKRIFKPVRKSTAAIIDRWEWTSGRGLMVTYTDGLKCRSDYTLLELLQPGRSEQPVEVYPPEKYTD
jgi:hypothetical protein